MAWIDIVVGELGSSVRNKINNLGIFTDALSNSMTLKADKRVPQILKTTSYALELTDAFTKQKCLSANNINITIPTNSTTNFAVDDEIAIIPYGVGLVTIIPTSGVLLNGNNVPIALKGTYKAATLTQIATNEWLLVGSLV